MTDKKGLLGSSDLLQEIQELRNDINEALAKPISTELDAKKESLRELLKSRTVRFDDQKPEHVYCVRLGGQPVFSLGNLSVISGKQKSRKSFLVSSLVAALLKGDYLNFETAMPSGKTQILYIDTEQGGFHVWQLVQGIVSMSAKSQHPNDLQVIRTRGFAPENLIEAIDLLLEESNDIGFVVIDGVRDLLYDINDPRECTAVSTKLQDWSQSYNLHICTILHENKNNASLRGHIGTELQNKAECVLNVKYVDETTSEVHCDISREQKPASFAFSVDENRHTQIVDDYTFDGSGNMSTKKSLQFDTLSSEAHDLILKTAFKGIESHTSNSLYKALQNVIGASYEPIGLNKVRGWVDRYAVKGLIEDQTPNVRQNAWCLPPVK